MTVPAHPHDAGDVSGRLTGVRIVSGVNIPHLPRGTLGYAEATSAQTGVSSETDITSLSVTVDVPANRLIRVSAYVSIQQQTGTGDASVFLYQDSTQIQRARIALAANDYAEATPAVIVEPSAGSITFKATLTTSANTVDTVASSTDPAQIVVEDVGAV